MSLVTSASSFISNIEVRSATCSKHPSIFTVEYRSSACLHAGSSCALRQPMGSLAGENLPWKGTLKQSRALSLTSHSVSLVGMQMVLKISGRLHIALDFIVVDLS